MLDEITINQTFGERLKAARLAKGWTQLAVGEKIGVRSDVIGAYEADKVEPKLNRILSLVEALDFNLDGLKAVKYDKGV